MSDLNFKTVLTMIAASTPDGRWNLLQAWLRKSPKWRKQVDQWAAQSPDQVIAEMEIWVTETYGIGALVLVNDGMREKIKTAIEGLQSRYNARVAEDKPEKETKNVRTRMDNGCEKKRATGKRTVKIGPARKNPKRASKDRD